MVGNVEKDPFPTVGWDNVSRTKKICMRNEVVVDWTTSFGGIHELKPISLLVTNGASESRERLRMRGQSITLD